MLAYELINRKLNDSKNLLKKNLKGVRTFICFVLLLTQANVKYTNTIMKRLEPTTIIGEVTNTKLVTNL
jgi:hypothetical protein